MKNTKIFAVSTAALMLSCAAVPMLATDTPTIEVGEGYTVYTEVDADGYTTPLVVNAEQAKFSVSVPTSLPVYMDAEGTITTATDGVVTNNSFGAVEITNVAMTATNDWALAVYDGFDASEYTDGTKEVAVILNGCETIDNDGAVVYDFDQDEFAFIVEGDDLALSYDVKLPSFSAGLSEASVLDIVMTIGFYQAG